MSWTRLVGLLLVAIVTAGCGDDEAVVEGVVSPDLDCNGARIGTFEPDLDPDVPGATTANAALDDVLVGWAAKFDGEVITLRPEVKAMVVDGRNVAVVFAREAPAGGYWADSTDYCLPFMVEYTSGYVPLTAPLETSVSTITSCEPVPRFRLGNVEYEVRQFDDVIARSDLGPIVGEIRDYPAGFDRCEVVVLSDGEGSLPVGTQIYEIVGVDRLDALTASFGNNRYLRFVGHPVS